MKVSTSLKLTCVVILGICSSCVTSVLLARYRPLRSPAVASSNSSSIPTQHADVGLGSMSESMSVSKPTPASLARMHRTDVANEVAPMPKNVRQTHFKLKSVGIQGDVKMIRIQASAVIRDTIKTTSFLWAINVTNKITQEPVLYRMYDHQQFNMENNDIIYPTFDDSIEIASGTYTVSIHLYAINAGFPLETLRNKDVSDSQQVLMDVKSVVVIQK